MLDLRIRKVESFLSSEISKIITSGVLKDPRVESLVTVAGVRVAKDLTSARIYISYFGDNSVLQVTVSGLNHAAGFVQARIGKQLRMRHTPKLRFIADSSISDGFRITQQLENLSGL